MNWRFENIHEAESFSNYLAKRLKIDGHEHWANEIDFYSTNAFTTTSEYFGELRILLKEIIAQNIVQKSIMKEIEEAIRAINKFFNQ